MATMNPAAANGSPYRVPPEPSRAPSIVMALVVHAGLLLFLWAGVSWQNTEPVAVEAEVWDMKTEQAAPQAPPQPVRPPPPVAAPVPKVVVEKQVERPVAPKPPDIALERIKEQKHKLLEKKLAEEKLLKEKRQEEADEKARELADEKAKDKAAEKAKELADKKAKEKADKLAKAAADAADKKKLDKLREAEMSRLTSQAGGTGTAAHSTAPRIDAGYAAAISSKIKSATRYAGDKDVPGNPRVEFKIEQLPTGEIISVRKIKPSGIPAFDDAVERAINKSSPLPKKKDGTVDRSIEVGFKLKEFSDAD
jgi:colicin import membrane protein